MGRHVIVGAGTIGTGLATRLGSAGEEVLVVSRRGVAPAGPGVGAVAADAADPAALAALCEGAEVLYNCANPPYDRWATDWPPLAASLLAAAERSGAVLVTLSNLYGYGPVDVAMTEELPLAATFSKGRIRAQMWRDAIAAHEAGRVRATEVRASDYFGPRVTDQGMLGERTVPRILAGKTVTVLGDPDMPHSWTYSDDVTRALQIVGAQPTAWGHAWHVPSGAAMSARDAIAGLSAAAGVPAPRVRRLPWAAVRAVGAFAPKVGGLMEVRYQFDRPFVLDSSAFTGAFGVTATPRDTAFDETVAWWRDRAAARETASSPAT